MSQLLEINDLCVTRGTKTVLHDISMRLEAGRTVAVLGPNGAGKSSLVLALAGVLAPASGSVALDGVRVTGLSPDRVRQAGIAAVPEGHQVLTRLTVRENLEVAVPERGSADIAGSVERAYQLFPELREIACRPAGALSGGQQQMVALAQGILSRPSFLLADEMSLGLAPVIVGRLMKAVRQIAAEGIGVLLIEQFTHVALKLADHVYVLNRGRIGFQGSPAELAANPAVLQEAYLSGGA
ncbi:MAG TPA: ABC transporter ATP-binding protein [Rhodocyclaceae bacterium]|nr:ABC transporter ATP-binding protein [Rhodocyclaceae bacterium]